MSGSLWFGAARVKSRLIVVRAAAEKKKTMVETRAAVGMSVESSNLESYFGERGSVSALDES